MKLTIAPITNKISRNRMIFVTKVVKNFSNFSNSEISASLILRPGSVPVDPDLDPRIDGLEATEEVDAVVPVALPPRNVTSVAASAPRVVVAPTVAAVVVDV